MKLPANIRACVTKNMPKWGKRFEKAITMSELCAIKTRAKIGRETKLRGALGDYATCVVGEFWGFRKKDQGSSTTNVYDRCGTCYEYSMAFHRADDLVDFLGCFEQFCEHAKEIHGKRFK